jgi:hypothetical protein
MSTFEFEDYCPACHVKTTFFRLRGYANLYSCNACGVVRKINNPRSEPESVAHEGKLKKTPKPEPPEESWPSSEANSPFLRNLKEALSGKKS